MLASGWCLTSAAQWLCATHDWSPKMDPHMHWRLKLGVLNFINIPSDYQIFLQISPSLPFRQLRRVDFPIKSSYISKILIWTILWVIPYQSFKIAFYVSRAPFHILSLHFTFWAAFSSNISLSALFYWVDIHFHLHLGLHFTKNSTCHVGNILQWVKWMGWLCVRSPFWEAISWKVGFHTHFWAHLWYFLDLFFEGRLDLAIV